MLLIGQGTTAQTTQTTLINPAAEGGFENGATFAANGWTTVAASANTWNVGTVPAWFTGTGGAYISNNSGTAWTYTNTVVNSSSFYRDVTFPAGITSVTLNFDWRGNGNDGNWDNLQVYIMDTSITPTTAGPVDQATTVTGWTGYTDGTTGYFLLRRNGTIVPTTTTAVSYNLTTAQLAYVSGKTKRLVFVWKNDGSGGTNPPASVDNISLTSVAPSCLPVTALTVASLNLDSAVINWTGSTSSPSQGYEYELRTSGAAGSGATGLVTSGNLAAGTTTINPNGLTASTSYTYYIRANCGSGDFSAWTSVSFFTGYCVPSSTGTATYINNFSTTGGATNISNLASGYTTGGYQNNYATAAVSQYATGTINFATAIVGGTVGTAIWVDWNNDFVFDNATERVFVTAAYGSGQTGTFTVPAGTPLGDYRMRVRIDFNAIAPDACASTNTRTEAEDYKLTVIAPPACLAPLGLTATANTAFTATLNWTASVSTPSNGYDFYYSDVNTAPTSGTTVSGSVGAGVITAPISGLLSSTKYYVWIRSNCGLNGYSDWSLAPASFTTPCNPPMITGTTPGSVCGQGSVSLAATSNEGTIRWYGVATGGNVLGTGTTFSTPSINTTTSYWAEAATLGSSENVGPALPVNSDGSFITTGWGVVFNAISGFTLNTVDIYPTGTGTITIGLYNSAGTELQATAPINVTGTGVNTSVVTVPLGFNVPVGTGYRLLVKSYTGITNLMRGSTGIVYPYTTSNASVTSGYNGSVSTTNYFFYNLNLASSCLSARTEVLATVATAPSLTLSNTAVTICPGQNSAAVTIATGAASYDTFAWSPSTNVTGDAVAGWVFNPAATTAYTLTASQSAGALCLTTANVGVTVKANPVISASAAQATICEGASTTLNATTSLVVGTASTLTLPTEQPTAFCNRWDQYWNQTVFTAAELQAAGLTAGNINSIAYNITTLGSGTNVTNFSVRIGATTNATTTAFVTTGLDVVYGPATYTHALGVNTITFDTPYVWDGTSNIILDIRQDGADSTNNAITYYTATAANMTISATTGTDFAVATLQSLVASSSTDATVAASVRRLNVVFGQTSNAITWSWNPGALTGNSVSVSPTATTSYTVRGTNPTTTCFTEAVVAVNVNPAPAPTGNATQVISVSNPADATVASLNATGTNVVWFETSANALSNTSPLASTAQLVSGQHYFAVQTTALGCRSTTALDVLVTVTLGASSFDLAGLKFYPNPVTNVLNLEYAGTITGVEVFNMLGQKIASKSVNEISTSVDMSNLASGSYFVKVKAENGSRTIKVMKN